MRGERLSEGRPPFENLLRPPLPPPFHLPAHPDRALIVATLQPETVLPPPGRPRGAAEILRLVYVATVGIASLGVAIPAIGAAAAAFDAALFAVLMAGVGILAVAACYGL